MIRIRGLWRLLRYKAMTPKPQARLSLIVACGIGGVIGKANQLPWRLPQDLQYFKKITLGKPVIMGRKTFESIGRPLPGRMNIVVTRQASWPAPAGVKTAASIPLALELARTSGNVSEIMVIGGEQIYRACLPEADRVYRTDVQVEVEGDAFFPQLSNALWRESSCIQGDADAPLLHTFRVFDRVH